MDITTALAVAVADTIPVANREAREAINDHLVRAEVQAELDRAQADGDEDRVKALRKANVHLLDEAAPEGADEAAVKDRSTPADTGRGKGKTS